MKREQLSSSDVDPRSFSWVEDSGFPQWLSMDSTPFWINGKPGSGKSTLMKYLSESNSTLKRLPSEGQGWAIVHLFFDYRAGKSTANDTLGMLKLFLRQLSMKIPDIAKRLEEQCTLRDELTRDRHETHIDVIADLIVGSGVKVCAFIDGLDEYEGDSWSLCSTLESLRSRTGIKMCLASRPEPAFEIAYSEFASITMQDIIEVASRSILAAKSQSLLPNTLPYMVSFPRSYWIQWLTRLKALYSGPVW